MKIAVVGPEGSGRTTIAAALGLPVLPSPKDEALAGSGYHTIFEWSAATAGGMADLLAWQAARERALGEGVVDAGVLDLFAHLQRWEWNRMSPEVVERLRDLVAEAAAGYTLVLRTAPRIVAGPAPARFRNRLHTLQIDRLLGALLGELVPAGRVHVLPDADLATTLALAGKIVACG